MSGRGGFTLIELIIVIAIFGLIMVATYETLVMTLQVEAQIEESTRSGKIGQAILMQIRRDLQSAAYHEQGRKIFLGVDHGDGDDAEDSLHFLTFAEVPPPLTGLEADFAHDVTSVGYVLKRANDGFVLFRRVKWNIDEEPLEGGHYFPIYEWVKGLSLRYFDGKEWLEEWSSEQRIPEEEEPEDENGDLAGNDGSGESAAPAGGTTGGEAAEEDEEAEEEVLPLPLAVEVILNVYSSDERGLVRDERGEPVAEQHLMVIPLPCMERVDLEEADSSETSGTGAGR